MIEWADTAGLIVPHFWWIPTTTRTHINLIAVLQYSWLSPLKLYIDIIEVSTRSLERHFISIPCSRIDDRVVTK